MFELVAEARVAWIPPRSRAEAVPAGPMSVSVAFYPDDGRHPFRRTAQPAAAVRLSRALNDLRSTHQLTVRECPFDASGVVVLTDRSALHIRVYNIPLGGCPFVRVHVDGDRQP